jgi:hypothetical protein
MIKRNKKEAYKSAQAQNVKIKLPFLLASIPESSNQLYVKELNSTRLELISERRMRCFGDVDVLKMMKLEHPISSTADLAEHLGEEFTEVPSLLTEL